MQRAWWIMAAASLFFFFVTAATFTSLGVVLFTMAAELHWSQSAAGLSFALLGLTCGLSSPLPALVMRRVGTRWTMFAGGVVLTIAFVLASVSHGLWQFFLATGLMGIGFTLSANIPSVYLLATWFPVNSARVIGFYFMAGAFGGVFGPMVVDAIVAVVGWRMHWLIMAIVAAANGIFCALIVTDRVPVVRTQDVTDAAGGTGSPEPTRAESAWTPRAAMLTRQFITIALAMLVIQTVVTTIHGMLVTHLANLGATRTFGAFAMGVLGLTDSLAKGAGGVLARHIAPIRLLTLGIAIQCGAVLLLPFASSQAIAVTFAIAFGAGWGASWLSAHLLLLEYFGKNVAAPVLSSAQLITTVAILGPVFAGMMADALGTFSPFFYVLAAMLAAIAVACAGMRAPMRQGRDTRESAPVRAPVVQVEAAIEPAPPNAA